MSKVLDHTKNDKTLKTYNAFALQHYSYIEVLFPIAQWTAFTSKRQHRHNPHNISLSKSYAQATCSAKFYGNFNFQIEPVTNQSTEFRKTFRLNEQSEVIIEPYGTNNGELLHFDLVKKILHGYHAAWLSRASLHLSLKTLQHLSCEMHSAVTLLKQVLTINLLSRKWPRKLLLWKGRKKLP